MGLIELIVLIAVAAFGLYLLGMAPLDPTLVRLIRAVVIFVVILVTLVWVLQVFGYSTGRINLPAGVRSDALDGAPAPAGVAVGQDSLLIVKEIR